jgi:rhodanese-related sulfurtransferase
MDTVFLSVPALLARLGTRHWPLVVDVRRPLAFDADSSMVAGALRCAPDAIAEFAARVSPGIEIVCYCAHGGDVSRGAAVRLRELGHAARILEGGIQAWREAGAPLITKNPALGVPSADSSRWVTRERPKIDRIACPWLIRRFIDPRAEFFYVPTREVFALAEAKSAVAFDIPGGAIEHDGELCSFDTLLRAFGLTEPALRQLAVIVRGADTARPELTPQSPGLLAVSLGLSQSYPDDLEMLAAGMVLYDALYAWCRHAQGETHGWHPETMR